MVGVSVLRLTSIPIGPWFSRKNEAVMAYGWPLTDLVGSF